LGGSSHLAFEVEDTGAGMPAEQLKTIWQQFSQGADRLRRGLEGSGLGLALVKMIVEAHAGEVAAQSTKGAGRVFGFRLPLRQVTGTSEVPVTWGAGIKGG